MPIEVQVELTVEDQHEGTRLRPRGTAVGAAVASHIPDRRRSAAWLPFVIMCGAVVITGNHFVIDIVAGVTFSLVALRASQHIHAVAPVHHLTAALDHGSMRVDRQPLRTGSDR